MGMFDFLTQPVASAAGAALSFLGGQSTNQANIDLANANNAWSAQQYATRYQTQVKDLEAAGLNPMLAVSQGAPPAPQAQPVVLQNPYHSAVQTFQEGMRTTGGYKRDVASAGLSEASAELTHHQIQQVNAATKKIIAETEKIPVETQQLRFLIQKLAEEAANIAQDTENKIHAREQIKALTVNIQKQTKLLDNQVRAEAAFDNFGREYKQYAPIVDLLKSILLPRSGGITINK